MVAWFTKVGTQNRKTNIKRNRSIVVTWFTKVGTQNRKTNIERNR